jgi:hypothetical protein
MMLDDEATREEARELAKQLSTACPNGCWIVDDHERNTVYYMNQKQPDEMILTPYTADHILIAHQFFGPAHIHHIALVKVDSSRRYYSPVW